MARPPHALPIWELEVDDEEDVNEPESLAMALIGAEAIVVLFIIAFVLVP